jgi:hypothetical protein
VAFAYSFEDRMGHAADDTNPIFAVIFGGGGELSGCYLRLKGCGST